MISPSIELIKCSDLRAERILNSENFDSMDIDECPRKPFDKENQQWRSNNVIEHMETTYTVKETEQEEGMPLDDKTSYNQNFDSMDIDRSQLD